MVGVDAVLVPRQRHVREHCFRQARVGRTQGKPFEGNPTEVAMQTKSGKE